MEKLIKRIIDNKNEDAKSFIKTLITVGSIKEENAGENFASFNTGFMIGVSSLLCAIETLPLPETQKQELFDKLNKTLEHQTNENMRRILETLAKTDQMYVEN